MPQGIQGVTAGPTVSDSFFKQRSRIMGVGYPRKEDVRKRDFSVKEAEMGFRSGMLETASMSGTARGEPGELVLCKSFWRGKETRLYGADEDIQERADGRCVVAKPGKTPEGTVICAPGPNLGLEVGMALVEGEKGRRSTLGLGLVWDEKRRARQIFVSRFKDLWIF